MFSGGGGGSYGVSVVVIASVRNDVMGMEGVVQNLVVGGGGVVPDVMVYSRVVDSAPVVSAVGSLICVEDVDPGFV